MSAGDTDKKAASAADVLRAYWRATVPYKWSLVAVIAGILTLQGASLAAPWFLRQFFNIIAEQGYSPEVAQQLFGILLLVVAVWLVEWVGRRVQDIAHLFFQARVMANLLSEAYDYLLHHSYNFFVSSFAGSITHKVSKFGRAYEAITDAVVLQFFPTFLFVTGAIIVLSTRHPWLGGALAIWTVLFMAFQIWASRFSQKARIERSAADTKVTATLSDSISNQVTTMLFSGQKHETGLFNKAVAVWHKATIRLWLTDNLIWAGIGLFMIAIEGGLLYGGIMLWEQGLFTVGDFVLVQAYLLTTFNRLLSINRELRRFYTALADAGEMVAILETPHEVKDKKNAKKLVTFGGEVWFDDVTFQFGDGKEVLRQFNLKIAPGEKVALVGPSGAGKSTVTKLLLRLYDVDSGGIYIDEQNIAHVTQESVRNAVAFVPQEPILFHRTLMENIRYGRRDATDAEVLAAAQQAHCHEFIQSLPLGYDTYVGERGIKLSGGERQRVAIARAILKNAPILVLDEATSSLDSESEAYIQDALETLMEGKTVITVAHRLSTIMKMDRIVVMQAGEIVAMGTHLELIRERGLYQKLWSIQAGGFLGDGEKPKEQVKEPTVPLADDDEEQ